MAARTLFVFCLVLLLDAPQAHSQPDSVYYTESGFVEFSSQVPLHSFTGESENLTGMIDPEKNVIDFYVDLNTLKTGIGKRDRDMYKTLNTDEYPFAEFTGSFDSPVPSSLENTDTLTVSVSGDFTINGISNPMTIEGILVPVQKGLKLESGFKINLNDHQIKPPGILFYRVDEIQDVTLEAILKLTPREQLVNSN
ncbi:YceI family protein [Gracilimonas sp. Q87]|uniref:YceI family protein n=1 Tax=Gracilimonas sp. Q87 TaxID=3384766 RepID=UPI003983F46D